MPPRPSSVYKDRISKSYTAEKSEEDFNLYSQVIGGAYVFHDTMLGVMMALAGDDTTVLLVSDHGFHPDHLRPKELPNEPAGPAAEHRPFGIFVAAGPGIRLSIASHARVQDP